MGFQVTENLLDCLFIYFGILSLNLLNELVKMALLAISDFLIPYLVSAVYFWFRLITSRFE